MRRRRGEKKRKKRRKRNQNLEKKTKITAGRVKEQGNKLTVDLRQLTIKFLRLEEKFEISNVHGEETHFISP